MEPVGAEELAHSISYGLCDFKLLTIQILAPTAVLLFLFAGIAYAAGQAFGAQTKARAQGWAMSLLTGGVIGLLIYALAPLFVRILTGMSLMLNDAVC